VQKLIYQSTVRVKWMILYWLCADVVWRLLLLYVDEEEDKASEDREGWETIVMDGQTYGVRTSAMDEKCQAFETLVIYCSTLGPRFAPYLAQTLEPCHVCDFISLKGLGRRVPCEYPFV
jgi:hypothetical protein